MLRELWLAPRFHTNMRGWLKESMEQGAVVEIWVLTKGRTEDYSEIDPVLIKRSRYSVRNDYLNKSYLPSMISIYLNLARFKPNRVIIRDPSRLYTIPVLLWSLVRKVEICFYNQEPVHGDISYLRWTICQALGVKFISPVLGDINKRKVSYMNYRPFKSLVDKGLRLDRKIDFICISKFNDRKRIEWFVRALAEVRHNRAVIIGEVANDKQRLHHEYILKLVDSCGLNGSLTIITNLPHSDALMYLAKSRVFCLPAKNEPASVSVVDAVEAGCDVICSDTCGTRWYDNRIKIFDSNSYEKFLIKMNELV